MNKSKLVAAAAAGLLLFSSSQGYSAAASTPVPQAHNTLGKVVVWSVFGCAGGIIAAAWVANYTFHRQLTGTEAATCGLTFWFNPNKK